MNKIMNKLAEMVGAKVFALEPDEFENEQQAIEEVKEAFKDLEFAVFLEVIAEWVFENYGEVVNMNID